ncbi:MAG: hypothetical protein MZW92_69605 [Comamonadaceae bacterium]|nr:hypothetical protein [Comamonadaceae bacterium]
MLAAGGGQTAGWRPPAGQRRRRVRRGDEPQDLIATTDAWPTRRGSQPSKCPPCPCPPSSSSRTCAGTSCTSVRNTSCRGWHDDGGDLHRGAGARCRRPEFDVREAAPGVTVVVPRTPVQHAGFHDDQIALLDPMASPASSGQAGITEAVVWLYTPMALPLVKTLEVRCLAYDCMDELSAFNNAPRQLRQRETALLKRAGVVFTGGPVAVRGQAPSASERPLYSSSRSTRRTSRRAGWRPTASTPGPSANCRGRCRGRGCPTASSTSA